MTDKQPTQEQWEELLKWCGLYRKKHPRGNWYMWYSPDGKFIGNGPPNLDGIEALGFLFKYAVPKALATKAIVSIGCPSIIQLYRWLFERWLEKLEGKPAALALFWTSWQVKEQSK